MLREKLDETRVVREDVHRPAFNLRTHPLVEVRNLERHTWRLACTLTARNARIGTAQLDDLRAELIAHVQNTHHPYNLAAPGPRLAYTGNHEGVADHFSDPTVRRSVELDLELARILGERITELELYLVRQAKEHDPNAFHLLRSIPGVGKILALTILYEVHTIERFPRVQDFASYCRLVKCSRESTGKIHGTGGAKIGNVHLKWAYSEAAALFLHGNPEGQRLRERLARKHGKGKAMSILAHRLARASYHMLTRGEPFNRERFMKT